MHFKIRYNLLFLTLIFLLTIKNSFPNEIPKGYPPIAGDTQNKNSNSNVFFPRIGLGIDGRTFAENDANYNMEIHRIIDIEAFRIKNFAFSFFVNEFLIFNNANHYYLKPYSINYTMDYGTFSWDFMYGIFSVFFDHNCSNIFNENKTNSRQLRWYGAGIRWESYGMKTGRKDIKININNSTDFKFINNLNYKFSFERKFNTQAFNYNYLVIGNLRYDILNYYFFIPYIEGSFTSLIDNRIRFNRSFEAGIRMHFNKGDIIPFAGINHRNDIDYYNGKEADLFYIGLAMETLLGNDDKTKSDNIKSAGLPFPEFHFSGSYGKFIKNDNLNFNTDIFIGMNLFSSSVISPFLNSRLVHSSQKAGAGMFPRYIRSNLEAGFTYRLKLINILIEPCFDYFRYDEGNYYHGYIEEFSTLGLRVKNREMKTGFANDGVDFNKASRFEWINRIDWLISAQKTIKENHDKYTYESIINLRWNVFRFKIMIPYISAGITLLKDDNYNRVYNIEHGVRIQNGLYWMLFYRFEYRTAVDPDNGLFRDYHLFGIRFEI